MTLTYKQLKWFILLIPTITVGLWEYVRHEYLLPYISMDVGNWLTPVIVLFVTFTLLTRFFTKLELMQEQLKVERAEKAVLEERERIAHDLHDGMAQSLFLLSIKVKQLEKLQIAEKDQPKLEALHKNIVDIHHYVRTGIENLRQPPHKDLPALDSFHTHIRKFENETDIHVTKSITMDEKHLTAEEKFELAACVGEALVNIRKHAQATKVIIHMEGTERERYLVVKDNGVGFDQEDAFEEDHYGLKMMAERCKRINWLFNVKRENNWTILKFSPK